MDEKKQEALPRTMSVKMPEQTHQQPPTLPVQHSEPLPQSAQQVAQPTQQSTLPVAQRVISPPSFTKVPPNDLYRRLLPAGLFLLTFVTVMTLLLMYMDTTALRAQQFRINMTHDYELRRIAQDDPSLVAYVRQLHLGANFHPHHHTDSGEEMEGGGELPDDHTIRLVTDASGNKYNGTFMEIIAAGQRDETALWLERARGWRGLVVRADPKDYLTLRAVAGRRAPTLHACLSPTTHPKEVTYYESARRWSHDGVSVDAVNSDSSGFSSRVLCFPLYTLLLVANTSTCDYLLLDTPGSQRALETLPFDRIHIQMLEIRMLADGNRTATTEFLQQKGYKVKAEIDNSVFYVKTTSTPTKLAKV